MNDLAEQLEQALKNAASRCSMRWQTLCCAISKQVRSADHTRSCLSMNQPETRGGETHSAIKVVELLLQQETSHALVYMLCDALC